MIFTVFIAGQSAEEHWQAELLEYSWQRAGQTGELVRLLPSSPQAVMPVQMLAQVEPTLCWTRHPYIDDNYFGYNVPAALLEWLLREQINATILLMETGSVLRSPFEQEVEPGRPRAHRWGNFPTGKGPFRLPAAYSALQAYCVNRQLVLPGVQLPLLIHSSDLLKICARWLELIGIIRSEVDEDSAPSGHALKIALAITLAECALEVEADDLGEHVIEAEDGGREFLEYSAHFESSRARGDQLSFLRPVRRPGVRQACVLDQWYLELGCRTGLITLNVSAGAIWKLCDGQRNLLDIVHELQAAYQIPLETMVADVTEAAKILRSQGAINLETLS